VPLLGFRVDLRKEMVFGSSNKVDTRLANTRGTTRKVPLEDFGVAGFQKVNINI
jgi:hypothetical protein